MPNSKEFLVVLLLQPRHFLERVINRNLLDSLGSRLQVQAQLSPVSAVWSDLGWLGMVLKHWWEGIDIMIGQCKIGVFLWYSHSCEHAEITAWPIRLYELGESYFLNWKICSGFLSQQVGCICSGVIKRPNFLPYVFPMYARENESAYRFRNMQDRLPQKWK